MKKLVLSLLLWLALAPWRRRWRDPIAGFELNRYLGHWYESPGWIIRSSAV